MFFVTKKKYNELLKNYNDLLKIQTMPTSMQIEYIEKTILAKFISPYEALKAWARIFTKVFLTTQAQNYIECTLVAHLFGDDYDENDDEHFVCTVQKYTGKTPHQLRREAEDERDALKARVKELEERLTVKL